MSAKKLTARTDDLGRTTRSTAASSTMADFYADFERDVAEFKRILSQLLTEIPGEFVAIHQGQMVGHASTWDELFQDTRRKFPDHFVLIERVAEPSNMAIDMDTIDT